MTQAGFQRGGAEMLHTAIMKPRRPEDEFFPGVLLGYQLGMRPPSIVMSAPVTLAVRSLARMSTRSAISSGRLNRPVTVCWAAWLWTSRALAPVSG